MTQTILTNFESARKQLVPTELGRALLVKNWKIVLAPVHSNIIWPNYFSSTFVTTLKAYLLNLLVFILALTFVTPVYLMEFLKKSGVSDTLREIDMLN